MKKFPINLKTIKWLNNLISERYGHEWNILKTEVGLVLKLVGGEGSIIFDVVCDVFLEARSNIPHTQWNPTLEGWKSVLDEPLPAPGLSHLKLPLIEKSGANHLIHYDILGLTYWMLARVEEIDRIDLDKYDRFPACSSHAYKNNYLDRPVVDEWLNVLGQVIQRQWPRIDLINHNFQMQVSHDVDSPSRYAFASFDRIIRRMSGDILRGDFSSALSAPWVKIKNRNKISSLDPFNTFDWIMDQSEQHGLKSTFYFICGKSSSMEGEYNIEHPVIKNLIKRINSRGHQIGLHPSFNTFKRPDLLKYEADTLKRICIEQQVKQAKWGCRMHYLRWKHPITMEACDKAGLNYDSTLGYADQAGFRCGTCFEYTGFDPVKSEEFSIRIRPLISMEATIIDPRYMALNKKDALKYLLKLKGKCRKLKGVFSLLWHNSNLRGYKKIYSELLF